MKRAEPVFGDGPHNTEAISNPIPVSSEQPAPVKNSKRQDAVSIRRQAIVLIHGIGEQQPMDTLRGFVNAVLEIPADVQWSSDSRPAYYSKPDMFSDSYELRRLSTTGATHPRSDFFELYWAHRMPAAKWAQLFSWLKLLLFRSYQDVPKSLLLLWWISWIIAVAVLVFLLATIVFFLLPTLWPSFLARTVTIPIGGVVILTLIQAWILSYIGDAAVYLSPFPRNIAARNAIRTAGVALLNRLHRSGEFDRIIIVGHSLGSVIGYDILTYAWPKYCRRHGCIDKPCRDKLAALEIMVRSMCANSLRDRDGLRGQWRNACRDLWREQRANGSPWLVTDFVTLGSPLAHADLLLAMNRADFSRKIQERELPVCPPVLNYQRKLAYPVKYKLPGTEEFRSIYLLHDAACFGIVRWTNIFFPCRWLLKGDLIGGPVSGLFGTGVEDRVVSTGVWCGFLAHTHYWSRAAPEPKPDNALTVIREAMDLRCKSFRGADRQPESL
jgi:hypothetical protein